MPADQPAHPAAVVAQAALRQVEQRLPEFLADLRTLVNMDSGSYDRADVARVGAWARARCGQWGAALEE
ncbi:MAG TPA: hypothetical protein VGR57_16360, partial [Ktedonobacterales bacterium]|nr:hypothetical protein [Ktedonobacterales bacterium]